MSGRDLAIFTLLIPGLLVVLVPIALGRARDASRGGWRTVWTVVAGLWFYSSWCGMTTFHCAAACGVALLVFRDGVLPTPVWIAIGAAWLALLGLGIVVTHRAVFVPAETRHLEQHAL